MSVPYKIVKITSPLSIENTGKYYAKFKSRGEIDLRSLAKRISRISTLSVPDTIAVLEALIEIIPSYLLDGYIVKLGDFGSFAPTLSSEGTSGEKDFSVRMIKKISMLFKAGKYMKKQLQDAKFEKVITKRHNESISNE